MKKQVKIRNLIIGGGAAIAVQSMTNVSVKNVDLSVGQIEGLVNAGCDIVRVALPNAKCVAPFKEIRERVNVPLVADIHFDAGLAVKVMEAGADKVRINPGNTPLKQLDAVIDCAKANGAVIRLGVNAGSVDKSVLRECGGDVAEAMARNLKNYVEYCEERNFGDLVLSVKSSDVRVTVAANRLISALPYPIHLGVTEAGLAYQGIIKNSIGIGALLLDGIGDTIRVSLTSDPLEEVKAGQAILSALGMRAGAQFVSCPKCGRCSVDLESVAAEVYEYIAPIRKNVKIAVMGCEVNGPGECRDADLGLAGAGGKFVFFKHGNIYKTVEQDNAVEEFKKEIDLLCK